jgi:hypothetical protein
MNLYLDLDMYLYLYFDMYLYLYFDMYFHGGLAGNVARALDLPFPEQVLASQTYLRSGISSTCTLSCVGGVAPFSLCEWEAGGSLFCLQRPMAEVGSPALWLKINGLRSSTNLDRNRWGVGQKQEGGVIKPKLGRRGSRDKSRREG